MMKKSHPTQPIENGRFKENKIVSYCLDNNTNMNDLALKDFSVEDRCQFAQLIGYSFSGYGCLSYVSEEHYNSLCPSINCVDKAHESINDLTLTQERGDELNIKGKLDSNGEVFIESDRDYCAVFWLNKDEAVKVIDHLQKVFDLKD